MTDSEDNQKRFEKVNEFIKSVTGGDSNKPYELIVDSDVVTLLGYNSINDVQWSGIEQMTNELENFKDKSYIIDFSNVTHLSSSVVALLVRIWKHANNYNQKFVMVSNEKTVTEVITVTGLDSIFKIYKTKDEALKAILEK
tara:strand:+ start:590 stop:1012 length:423 start_codon:yes stop_codon:yes gene_type:complete